MAVACLQPEEELFAEISKHFINYLSNSENVETAASTLVDDLIEDAIMNVIFDVDMERKSGLKDLELGEPEDEKFQVVDVPELDIFGQTPGEKSYECICPSCKRTLAASRFAPHLAKCMGMGRNSSRIASRRIGNNANKDIYSGTVISDDDDDADWTVGTEKKGKKKKEKIQVKKISKSKSSKNGHSATAADLSNGDSSTLPSTISLENLSEPDRRALFAQVCGVVSEHTKKICRRSLKCPQHTDEQRKAVRDVMTCESLDLSVSENLQVDVDTYEEGDGQNMRECLGRSWEAEHSNTSSPADSASTSSSSSKKKEKQAVKAKGKGFSNNNKSHKHGNSHEGD